MTITIHTATYDHLTVINNSQKASSEVAETIIAHQTASITERAYNRTDFLEQRRELMEAWEKCLKLGD